MITFIEMRRFKRFEAGKIEVSRSGTTLLAGPNNSGKSTLLHALAVWSFCVFVLRRGKGDEAILTEFSGQGYGISDDDFNPINLPDLKHLWYGLKTQIPGEEGYSLSIRVDWEHPVDGTHYLTISLSLTNDRLFIRANETTLTNCDALPEIVYLPPVAGLDAKEPFATPALRRAMLGRGLAGSVLRNVLFDLRQDNEKKRAELKEGKSKISNADLKALRDTDPWERLQATLRRTFGFEIVVADYDETYHTTLQAFTQPVEYDDTSKRYRNAGAKRDLMVEGAGALQWICVYAYAVNPDTDILLLDEPDAHLHSSLQGVLIDALEELIEINGKQVLVATHSREVLLGAPLEKIISFEKVKPKYLSSEADRVRMFSGLGEVYDPFIDRVRKTKRVVFVENNSDLRALKAIAATLGRSLPKLEAYPTTESHKDRRKFFQKLEKGIPGIRALSFRDRDGAPLNTVCEKTLRDKSDGHGLSNFASRTSRRREIENYALVPACIARTLGLETADIRTWWEEVLFLPWSEAPPADATPIMEGEYKEALTTRLKEAGKSMDDLWAQMTPEDIHDDLKILVSQLENL
ncbi:ATP-dependent nuclease [Wenxinia saemankumensis]|uniref:Predicted ATP-dependent endonuclease of the OLD family, contains P-loop ATPase and TOPRIM domains n=1 Tax=Wenxinia saemankumensis TaxID=1447782 RepID=A0A1M6I357_9RHOB|nr:AAA family ATPase [Wenxinia saemankumensis]SHJ28852.1 Predicted ATP-dependent endonuclease of the OLD family, contains P-loop ATPase and TOPRIM domains [Wenxinia saemankumensis]